jgi:hypothetical protein
LAIYLLTLDSSVGLLSPALLLYFVFITFSTLEIDPALAEPLEPQLLKGRSEPIEVYRLA